MSLPQHLKDKYSNIAKDSFYMGEKLESYTHQELMIIVCVIGENYNKNLCQICSTDVKPYQKFCNDCNAHYFGI